MLLLIAMGMTNSRAQEHIFSVGWSICEKPSLGIWGQKLLLRAGEVAFSVSKYLCKREDLNSNSQHSCKKPGMAASTCVRVGVGRQGY